VGTCSSLERLFSSFEQTRSSLERLFSSFERARSALEHPCASHERPGPGFAFIFFRKQLKHLRKKCMSRGNSLVDRTLMEMREMTVRHPARACGSGAGSP
jgi:hypothetical protein